MPFSRPSNRITLKDVAKEAGVSVQTASHVLADNRTVRLPEATRQKVREAATKIGYQPNRYAQAIRSGKTNVIAVWMPLDRPIVTYMRMLHQMNLCARETGHELMIVGFDRENALKAGGKLPTNWPVDGILSLDAGKAVQHFREAYPNDCTPICVLGYEQVANSDSVVWNLKEASYEATKAMIARGRKKIVHATPDWVLEQFPNERRRRGYSEAMVEAGLKPRFVSVKGERSSDAQDAVGDMLETGYQPDAVFCFTDTLSIGASRALLLRGLTIPEDCVVWGMGDYPEAEDFYIPLSTLRHPIEKVIRQAWTWLVDRIENPDQARRDAVLPMEFIERESTKASTKVPGI